MAYTIAFARQTLEWHQQTPPHARWRDLIDDMMAGVDLDGQRPNEDDLTHGPLATHPGGLSVTLRLQPLALS